MCRQVIGLIIVPLAVVLSISSGLVASAQFEPLASDREALRNRYERICAPESRDFDQSKCMDWWNGLRNSEQRYLEDEYLQGEFVTEVGEVQVDEPERGVFGTSGTKLCWTYNAAVTRRNISRTADLYTYRVFNRWCGDNNPIDRHPFGRVICGSGDCYSYRKIKEKVWEYKGELDSWRNTTADFTNVYRSARFRGCVPIIGACIGETAYIELYGRGDGVGGVADKGRD